MRQQSRSNLARPCHTRPGWLDPSPKALQGIKNGKPKRRPHTHLCTECNGLVSETRKNHCLVPSVNANTRRGSVELRTSVRPCLLVVHASGLCRVIASNEHKGNLGKWSLISRRLESTRHVEWLEGKHEPNTQGNSNATRPNTLKTSAGHEYHIWKYGLLMVVYKITGMEIPFDDDAFVANT